MSHLIYQASWARIDDLLREAGDSQRASEARRRPDASTRRMLRKPQRGLGQLRRVLAPIRNF
jgi:hypothetical protein